MKKSIITIAILLFVFAAIGMVLATNKNKIDQAAELREENAVIPVQVHTVKRDSFTTGFSVNGTTAPGQEVKIASEVQGKLTHLYIQNGDMVRTGQIVAALDASVYLAQLNSIEHSIAKTNLDISRYTKLVEMGGATPMQVESAILQLNSLNAQKKEVLQWIDHMKIRAPFSGRIENVNVETGSFVSFGSVIADILDNSALKIRVYLSEQQAFDLRTGSLVEIHTPVLDQPVKGDILMISDKADASGKFMTEIQYKNTGRAKLKAGMLVDITFNNGTIDEGLSIPAAAITGSLKEPIVFVVKDGTAEIRSITPGIVTTERIQVLEGLSEGEQVIISGQLNLEEGTNISIRNEDLEIRSLED